MLGQTVVRVRAIPMEGGALLEFEDVYWTPEGLVSIQIALQGSDEADVRRKYDRVVARLRAAAR